MLQINNIQEIEAAVNQYGEIVLSKSEDDNVIIMSLEEYKNKLLKKDIKKHLKKSEENIKKGKTKKAEVVFKELEEKYGF